MNIEEIKPEETLDTLRTLAKLDSDNDRALRDHGNQYREATEKKLREDLDRNLAEAWDAIEVGYPNEFSGYRQACVVIELRSGKTPYVKGFLLTQMIPAFEITPSTTKKPSLSSLVAVKAFSDAVDSLPNDCGYAGPRELTPEVPLQFFMMDRNSFKFNNQQ